MTLTCPWLTAVGIQNLQWHFKKYTDNSAIRSISKHTASKLHSIQLGGNAGLTNGVAFSNVDYTFKCKLYVSMRLQYEFACRMSSY